jgi:hypothetical protein
MIVQCCLCKKVRKGKQWVTADPIELADVRISHGYCPACAAQAFAEIRALIGMKCLTSNVAAAP